MRSYSRLVVVLAAFGIAAEACSSASTDALPLPGRGASGPTGGSSNGSASPPGLPAVGLADEAGGSLPPETKVESNYQSPVATGNVVWIANPTSGRVAYIDSKTFGVKTERAGDGPTYLAAVRDPDPSHQPPHDRAVVLNVVSHDATLFTLAPPANGSDIDGALTKQILPSTTYANAWAVSKSGRWAIAWTDTGRIANASPTQGYQRIEVLDLTAVRPPTALSVGFLPVQMVFSADETRCYAVTADGITVIDLLAGAAPGVSANYPLGAPAATSEPDAATDTGAPDAGAFDTGAPDAGASDTGASDAGDAAIADARTAPSDATTTMTAYGPPDVSFSPDASYALVRQDGVRSIAVISLADGKTTLVQLPGFPTDLTMSPTGTFAVAVLRDTSTVVVLPVPGIAGDPTSFQTTAISGETIGRAIVTRQGQTVLLFTTAIAVDRLTVLTLQPTPTYRTIPLHAPIVAVFPTDDAQNAIVLHGVPAGSNDKGAFSIVPIATTLPASIEPLPAPATAVALTNERALVTVSDTATATYAVYRAAMPSLVSTKYALASPPIAVGIVPGAPGEAGTEAQATGYVAQDYSEGRITFIDLSARGDGGARTITGFELSAGIVEGTEQ